MCLDRGIMTRLAQVTLAALVIGRLQHAFCLARLSCGVEAGRMGGAA